ncbi:META domain-containing protein [Burkholderia vietnamiensis]|uniref:META domain-containing protein n=1 Tax=Burkholderia vietnamiensis TaxID=60552 RepID=UPI000D7856A3|nr:META domain-containing protein [Burkholderia vietnamiensis]GBH26030.1 META domain-containing protein [Burkholderia vietnamiensis]
MSHLSAARARTGLLRPLRAPLCALTLATLLAACAMPTHPDSAAPAPDPYNPAAVQLLDDPSWELTSWAAADGTPRPIPHGDNGEPIRLALSTESGGRRARGFSGCNRYMGTYAIKNGLLSFGPLAGTRMACPNALGGQLEHAYLDALAHVQKTGVQMREPQQLQNVTEAGGTLPFTRRGS